jgi:dTDP-glucose pyrophosphorylase
MFKWVIKNIVPDNLIDRAQIHIIIRKEHLERFMELKDDDRIKIHIVPELTEGAACTVLTIKEHINNDLPLVIANSDQYLEWDAATFYMSLFHPEWDGVISTFDQHDPTDLRWSYAQVDKEGCIKAVAEKVFVGPIATTGIYGWSKGSSYVSDTETMISANIRVNNEFYVCPVYNIGIERGDRIRTHMCKKMWGLGVPADYELFLKTYHR